MPKETRDMVKKRTGSHFVELNNQSSLVVPSISKQSLVIVKLLGTFFPPKKKELTGWSIY